MPMRGSKHSAEMLPSFTPLDLADCALIDGVVSSNNSLQTFVSANTTYFFCREFVEMPALANCSVAHVVNVRAEPKVFYIDADGSVALVPHLPFQWDRTLMGCPTRAMCVNHFSASRITNIPIAILIGGSDEVDATVGPGLAPVRKSLFQRQSIWCTLEFSHRDVTASLEVRTGLGADNADPSEYWQEC